jgi:cyclic pyranopterin phosphate synthase
MSGKLTHFDEAGAAHMVDVGGKDSSARVAVASGFVHINAATMDLVRAGTAKKGDVLGTARLAGIMAAKKCADLIPLCHPLPLTHVALDLTPNEGGVAVQATCKTTGQTGVEMEALTAVSIACLTIYDMLKAAQKDMVINAIRVELKEGGKSGRYVAAP